MSLDYNINNYEYNGGIISYSKIDIGTYVAPAAYTDYTQLGGTEGIQIEFDTDQEGVYSDQAFGEVDMFKKAVEATITIQAQESTLTNLLLAVGYDATDTTEILVSGATDHSVIKEDTITTQRAYFGAVEDNLYFDLQFEKQSTHNTALVFGWRVFKATPTGVLSFESKLQERTVYQIAFKALATPDNETWGYNGHIGYFFKETAA